MSNPIFSRTRLDRMREIMARHVDQGDVPGLLALVDRGGETHLDIIGQQADGGRPLQRDSIFRITSLSKPVGAALAMIMVEECLLRLDDAVDRLLPELADRRVMTSLNGPLDETVPANRPITLRDLLTFTLGPGLDITPRGFGPITQAMNDAGLNQGPPAPQNAPEQDEWLRRLGASVDLMTMDQLTPAQKARGGFGPDDFANRGWGFCLSVVTRRDDYSGGV